MGWTFSWFVPICTHWNEIFFNLESVAWAIAHTQLSNAFYRAWLVLLRWVLWGRRSTSRATPPTDAQRRRPAAGVGLGGAPHPLRVVPPPAGDRSPGRLSRSLPWTVGGFFFRACGSAREGYRGCGCVPGFEVGPIPRHLRGHRVHRVGNGPTSKSPRETGSPLPAPETPSRSATGARAQPPGGRRAAETSGPAGAGSGRAVGQRVGPGRAPSRWSVVGPETPGPKAGCQGVVGWCGPSVLRRRAQMPTPGRGSIFLGRCASRGRVGVPNPLVFPPGTPEPGPLTTPAVGGPSDLPSPAPLIFTVFFAASAAT